MVTSKKKFYVTTAIDYPNSTPHIGHAYQKIVADVLARWHKVLGEDVWFLTGTDEHGRKIQEAAEKAGKTPKQFVDELSVQFKEAWSSLNIQPNRFIRTTDPDHEKLVQDVLKKCYKKGDIYKGEYEGLYCLGCEAYYTEKDLVDGECPFHPGKKVQTVKEESYFFKLGKYQKFLLDLYKKDPNFILPVERKNEIINRVKEGLKDLSISRTGFNWGIPIPFDKKHVTYVWFDALFNYISGSGKNHKYWPASTHLLGKDNAWFHAVYWPAFLKSAGYKLPKTVFVHGFLTFDGQKISKSLGNVISPKYLSEKYGADPVRYFMCRQFPFAEGNDGDVSEKILVERNNSELADKLGNLVSRIAGLIERIDGSKIKQDKTDKELAKKLNLKKIIEYYNNYEIDKAISEIFSFIDECNLYVQQKEPWRLSGKELNKVLYSVSDSIRIISILLYPVIPASCERISEIYGFDLKEPNIKDTKFDLYKPIKAIKKQNIFVKIESDLDKQMQMSTKEKENIKPAKKTEEFIGIAPLSEIKYDEFAKLDIRVAKILDVKPHPNADKLLVIDIDLGFEKRTIVAGLKEHYKPEQLKGKKVIVLANLEPKELRGIMSKGMILAAVNSDRTIVSILHPEKDIPVGSKIS